MKRIEFSQEQIQDIIDMYNCYETQKSIGDKYQVCRTVIKRILLENNVNLRETTTKYHTDINVFENIDNPEKAYWLGFLAADGCNYQREHNATIVINLSAKDKNHLIKFQNFCKSNAKIIDFISTAGYSNNTPMCKIAINSTKMSNDLANKGIVPRKSLILQPPNIDEQYYLPFICGYFDGDGSIYKTSQYNNFNISFEGTKEILNWINNLLNISNTLEKRHNDNKNNYYIRCGGTNKPYKILYQLYNSCETHLDRKYQLYKNLETVVLNRNIQ